MNVDAALVAKLLQIGLFSIPLIISPGPNNLMTTANCAQFGYRRTLPSLTGISVGVFVLFMVIALGLSSVLSRYPLLHPALKVVGTAYILYLAYKLYTSQPTHAGNLSIEHPITFGEAALLQILNPKIWLLGASATSTFLPLTSNLYVDATLLSLTLGIIFFPCNSIWAVFGLVMAQVLRGRALQRTLALLSASSIAFLLF
ncbi:MULTISPECIES: LysE family translocator [Burkholderia]|uniref:LysE family translocator n=1 Tax=Burkholderia contaminans TaxID=488447 RepID=A0A2S5E517_9BURK|nr:MULTISPECIES: LysE family translocator [Burkholderia]EKS9794135.1 LysE family translocator [Burkholderia cepacia]EKS9802083.1 LysE family translocator [Burkholderia cepacia]EKS9810720.1 LysE family translocator [Burkholderia cepacia]EKS9816386.1 LysE family translocator [Burkholderia cepacia]EKS9827087.1 LysE family translocator [Burkholderia cepacia]